MKKTVTAFLCLLLIAALATTAFAAGSASFSMSASGTALRRGDTVTFTVSVSCSEPATSYGLQLGYDTSVFELVSGSTNASGALINSFNNGFAFMFQNSTAYSGSVGTVTLKVKDNAAFGSYTVSGTASVKNGSTAVAASGCSKTITVVCDHSYGSWINAGDETHSRACAICTKEETANHIWNGGTVTKPATCKEEGEKSYSCTVCGVSRTESIPKTNDHVFGSLTAVDSNSHKDTCSVCKKEVAEVHTWGSGKVTKPATCKEEGEKTYTCDGCKYVKTEKLNKTTDHTYGTWQNADEANHKHTCSVCQKEETAAHTWNKGAVTKKATCKEEGEKTYTCTGCKATKAEKIPVTTTHSWGKWAKAGADTHKRACTVCEKEETGNHSYKTSWSKNKTNHYHECSVCKDQKDAAKHTPGPEATETKPQTCTVCKYIIKAALGHTHDYAKEWTADENGHWYTCSGCEEKGSYADHDFENACDPDCAVCGYARETSHNYGDSWATDGENHWHLCAGCGDIQDQEAHTPGAEATAAAAQTCTVCGYEIAPALGVEETEPVQDAAEETKPAGQNTPADGGFPWWIVIVALAVAGGAAVLVVLKKKK